MGDGGRLLADDAALRRAGDDLQALSDGLQQAMATAAASVRATAARSADDDVARALDALAHELSRAGAESVTALGVLGRQVELAASAYRQADAALAAAAPEVRP